MLKFTLFIFLMSLSCYADEIKFPDPDIKQDIALDERSKGDIKLRRKLAIDFVRNYFNAYETEYKRLNPSAPNPFKDSQAVKNYEVYINEKVSLEQLNAPITMLKEKIKAELDMMTTGVAVQYLSPEQLVDHVVKLEVELAALNARLKNGLLAYDPATVDGSVTNPGVQVSRDLKSWPVLVAIAALVISLLNLFILLRKR